MTIKTKSKVTALRFRVPIVVKADSSGYYAYSPTLKGICVDGKTREEALQVGIEAARLLLLSMIESGDPIPLDILGDRESAAVSNQEKDISYHVEEIRVDCK